MKEGVVPCPFSFILTSFLTDFRGKVRASLLHTVAYVTGERLCFHPRKPIGKTTFDENC